VSNKIYLKLIFETNHKHPAIESPIAAFVYYYQDKSIKHYNFSHPDIRPNCTFEEFKEIYKGYDIFVIDKKRYLYFLDGFNLNDINVVIFSSYGELIKLDDNVSLPHINGDINKYNYILPFTNHQTNFENEVFKIKKIDTEKFDLYSFNFFNNFLSETLYTIEKNGIKVDVNIFKKLFNAKTYNDFVYTQYNIYNPTGRPSNHFDNVNYVALNKENGCRSSFISRYKNG